MLVHLCVFLFNGGVWSVTLVAGEVGGVIGRAEGGTAGKVQCVCVQMVHIAWFTGLLKIREKVLPGVQCLRMYLISTKAHAKLLWLASNVILNEQYIHCWFHFLSWHVCCY